MAARLKMTAGPPSTGRGLHRRPRPAGAAYDGLGNLVRAEYPEIDYPKTWKYDANGQPRREFYGTGPDDPPQPRWVAYAYDGLGRVSRKCHVIENSGVETILRKYVYAYEGNGNVSGIAHAAFGGVDGETFAYDHLNRLTGVDYALAGTPGAGSIGYSYDRFGNLYARDVQLPEGAAGARSFDFGAESMGARNRLPETAGPFTYSYDERGNLTGVTEQVGEDDFIDEGFDYDPENRLERYHRWWEDPVSGLPLEAKAEYLYDDGYRRIFARGETGCPYRMVGDRDCYNHVALTATLYLPGG